MASLTPDQIKQYYATEGNKANPISPLDWLDKQQPATPAAPVVTPTVQPKTTVQSPSAQSQVSAIQTKLSDLVAQQSALKQYGLSDTSGLVKSSTGTYAPKSTTPAVPEQSDYEKALAKISGSSSTDSQTQLANYIAKITSMSEALPTTYQNLLGSTGVTAATEAVGTTQKEITKTQALIDNLEGNINSRIKSASMAGAGPITEAQRQRIYATEQKPLVSEMGTEQQTLSTQQAGLTTAQQKLAQQWSNAQAPLQTAQSLLPAVTALAEYQSPQDQLAAKLAEEEAMKEAGLGQYATTESKTTTVPAGSSVIDSDGNVIFTAPTDMNKTYSVSPGSAIVDASGKVIYQAPATPKEASIPTSYTEWQLAGGSESGMTYAQYLTTTKQTPTKTGANELKESALSSAQRLLDLYEQNSGDMVGGLNSYSSGFPGTVGADFVNTFNTLKSQLSLDNVSLLKGQGQVSDAERKLLSEASTVLNRTQSKSEFISTLNNIIKNLSGTSSTGGANTTSSGLGYTIIP